jgi:hypothetical protein
MSEKSKEDFIQPDFAKIYAEYPDEEIISILKKRKHYQKKAAKQAIQEAIKRGIIHSEQDLFSDEYKVEPLKYSIIPTIENEATGSKIRKSIARSLLITGVLPVVWGAIKILHEIIFEGSILFILGCVWIYVCIQLVEEFSLKLIYLLFLLLSAAIIYITLYFTEQKTLNLMDVLVAVILFGLIIYALLFLRKLKS